jgi:hypothetical protein
MSKKFRTSTFATYVKDMTVTDPETKAPVEITLFKHSSGGMFALDASYIDQCLDEDLPVIQDPFNVRGKCTLTGWDD